MTGRSRWKGLLTIAALLSAATATAGGPRISLTWTPRLPMADLSGGAEVRLRLTIDDPGPELYCPRIEWTISEVRSSHEADCGPWDSMTPAERPTRVSETKVVRLGAGAHQVTVRVTQGRVSRVVSGIVEVRG